MSIHTNPLAALLRLSLSNMPNEILASANLGLSGFRKIAKVNPAYQAFLDTGLIREDGSAVEHESLLAALAAEIHGRIDAGTFV